MLLPATQVIKPSWNRRTLFELLNKNGTRRSGCQYGKLIINEHVIILDECIKNEYQLTQMYKNRRGRYYQNFWKLLEISTVIKENERLNLEFDGTYIG